MSEYNYMHNVVAENSAMKKIIEGIRNLHREENGKCMGCPISLRRDGSIVYDSYPCRTVNVLEGK